MILINFLKRKKGIIQYNKSRSINDKNNKFQQKYFINKDLSIDSINLNIPGKNDNSSENNKNIKNNLNEKKILNDFKFEHNYRISSPALDYSEYYITNINKTSDSKQKIDLNRNKKGNIISKSQDNYKKIKKIKTSKTKEEKYLEKNTNIQEYKYNEKSSKKNICFPQ